MKFKNKTIIFKPKLTRIETQKNQGEKYRPEVWQSSDPLPGRIIPLQDGGRVREIPDNIIVSYLENYPFQESHDFLAASSSPTLSGGLSESVLADSRLSSDLQRREERVGRNQRRRDSNLEAQGQTPMGLTSGNNLYSPEEERPEETAFRRIANRMGLLR